MPSDSSASAHQSEKCERCSNSFGVFKRRKTCTYCRQEFCNSCLIRLPEMRVCVTCDSFSSADANEADIMRCKTKHLRNYLTYKNIDTSTCKEKRELVELILRLRPPQAPNSRNQEQRQQQNQGQHQQQQPNFQHQNQNGFNNTLNNLMSNIQEFVNFNVNNAFQQGNGNEGASANPNAGSNRATQSSTTTTNTTTTSSTNNGNTTTTSSSSSSSSFDNPQPQQAQQQPNHAFAQNIFSFNPGSQAQPAPAPPPRPPPPHQPQSQSTINDETAQPQSTPNVERRRRASLSDIQSEAEIENLNVKQMKEILSSNFVEYKGCVEKNDLVQRLKLLYESNLANKRLQEEIAQPQPTESTISDGTKRNVGEDDLCKICMDSLVDCVLIECGHMVACTKCGKRLAECPICRQNVVRVIRVFKS